MNAYDFDKTIYKNDSSTDFLIYCLFKHPKAFCRMPSIIAGYVKYFIFKKGRKEDFKEKAFSIVKYCDIDRDIADFWQKNKVKIKKFYLEQKHEDDVIISASPRFLLEPICSELGIKYLICTEVDKKTGKFLSLNCWGKEKVVRFKMKFKNAEVKEFYSDSYSDTPMAELAKIAFLVKGERLLPWK